MFNTRQMVYTKHDDDGMSVFKETPNYNVGDNVRIITTDREFVIQGIDDDCAMDEFGTWYNFNDIEICTYQQTDDKNYDWRNG